MAKQKIVVKVTMNSDKKSRKALQIAVSLFGVESASFVGSDKDQIAVTGEGIDSVELATLLRKGVGYTELVSVGPVEEKKAEAKESKPTVVEVNPYQYNYNYYGTPYYVYGIPKGYLGYPFLNDSEKVPFLDDSEDKLSDLLEEESIPEWKDQITFRGLVVSALLGTLFCIITHKLNLTVGIIPSLNVAAGLLGFFCVKSWTTFLQKFGFSVQPFTRQENTVIQTCVVACYGLAFSGVRRGVAARLSLKLYEIWRGRGVFQGVTYGGKFQKIVVKVTMNSDKKSRKALTIAVSLDGVESASFVGSDKDQIAVTGEGIDSVELATLLRKGVGYTELVSVGPVEEKKPEAKESKPTVVEVNPYQYYYNYYGTPYYVYGISQKLLKYQTTLTIPFHQVNYKLPELLLLIGFHGKSPPETWAAETSLPSVTNWPETAFLAGKRGVSSGDLSYGDLQKIVVKVTMNSDKKSRKALQIAVSLFGVESASFVGSDKDQIAVTGEGIDSVELATLLRKGVGYTELVSVGPVEEKKPEAKESKATVVEVYPYQYSYNYPYNYYGTPTPYYVYGM
ncbi:hypothetical protein OSB04_006012 [Centaurea solstitialis]|uniref:HMA domain-containing protein n=1 Tax=Centaurea solstitialis TaxID=347529 RepID=A0AA38WHA3_9ASTR|nr:hypothetical protein OSB04_006012 [Centaurea solstitialis]